MLRFHYSQSQVSSTRIRGLLTVERDTTILTRKGPEGPESSLIRLPPDLRKEYVRQQSLWSHNHTLGHSMIEVVKKENGGFLPNLFHCMS